MTTDQGAPTDLETLLARVDRLESLDQIRQLPAKYALALDMRDADAWVGLFPDDVKVGDGRSGRAALRDWFRASGERMGAWSLEIYGDWYEDVSQLETTIVYALA